jgi:hypothetical protein
LNKLKGFVVTDTVGNSEIIENKPVICINDLQDKDCTMLISVSDIYQNEIMDLLKSREFKNVVCAYRYSFLAEELSHQDIPNVVMIDVRELLAQQYHDNKFNRYDIIVRLLAVRNYFGENNFGFDYYRRMQDARVHDGYSEIAVKRFAELIESFQEHGYDSDSEIIVDKNLKLMDGSHRMALAIYMGIPYVRIRIQDKIADVDYGMEWFQQQFSKEECEVLHQLEQNLYKKCHLPIKGIIWPAAQAYFDEITKEITGEFNVSYVKDYSFPKSIFPQFAHQIYKIDEIAEWKINMKLEHIGDRDIYKVRILDIDMDYPDFRIKKAGKTISREGEKLKCLIREKYRDKVENYFTDIIIHTADNYMQSEYIEKIVKQNYDSFTAQ